MYEMLYSRTFNTYSYTSKFPTKCTIHVKRNEEFHIHTMKAYTGNRVIVPLMFTLGARQSWGVNITPRRFSPPHPLHPETNPVHIE